ncbi:hypothetical protein JOC36_001451 [Weissella uvarum]|uniref:hypothetical protein n=1 Tax=Weissella uvarum TaxID=1479233 RepID=UPI00195FFBF0|nr:hypothetical protein [Weissella uvarum]MBM7617858.1 hypothetical protein [Weissella uvarum]MCM0596144.1 hypothetical protein [Weissella uvarum]
MSDNEYKPDVDEQNEAQENDRTDQEDLFMDMLDSTGIPDKELGRTTVLELIAPDYIGFDSTEEDFVVVKETPAKRYFAMDAFASPKSFPARLTADIFPEIQSLGYGISMSIHPVSNQFARRTLKSERTTAKVQAIKEAEKGLDANGNDTERLVNNIDAMMQELESGTNRIFDVSLNFQSVGKNTRETRILMRKLEKILSDRNIILKGYEMNLGTGFKASAPVMLEMDENEPTYRRLDLTALSVLDMGRLDSGAGDGGIIVGISLAVPSEPLVHQSVFGPENENYNVATIGPPGSGKSLYMKLKMRRNYLLTNEAGMVIDSVGEYVHTARSVGARVVRVDPSEEDSRETINPIAYQLVEEPIERYAEANDMTVEEVERRYSTPNAARKIVPIQFMDESTGETFVKEFIQNFDKKGTKAAVVDFIQSLVINLAGPGNELSIGEMTAINTAMETLLNEREIRSNPDSLYQNDAIMVNGVLYEHPKKPEITLSELHAKLIEQNQVQKGFADSDETVLSNNVIRIEEAIRDNLDGIFDGQGTIDFDNLSQNRLVVFDISPLAKDASTMRVVENLLMYNVWYRYITAAKNSYIHKSIYLDEVLKNTDDPTFMKMLSKMIRESRKYEAGINWAIQDYASLKDNKAAQGLLVNTGQYVLFKTAEAETSLLQQEIGISEGVTEFLSSGQEPGTGVLISGSGRTVPFKTNPTAEELKIFESNEGRRDSSDEMDQEAF